MSTITLLALHSVFHLCLAWLDSDSVVDEPSQSLCGAECLYVAIGALNPSALPRTFLEFSKSLPPSTVRGYSMADLQDIAESYGLYTELLRLRPEELGYYSAQGVVILRFVKKDQGHFVLCDSVDSTGYRIFDQGRRSYLSPHQIEARWSGETIVLSIEPIKVQGSRAFTNWLLLAIGVSAVLLIAISLVAKGSKYPNIKLGIVVLAIIGHSGCNRENYAIEASRDNCGWKMQIASRCAHFSAGWYLLWTR